MASERAGALRPPVVSGAMRPPAGSTLLRLAPVLLALLSLLPSACVYWTPRSQRPTASAVVIPNVPMQKWGIESCGAGALSSVLQHYGEPTSMRQWDASLPKTRGGVLSIDMVLAARQKGFESQLVTGDRALIEKELAAGHPVILMLQVVQAPGSGYDFFHYVVLDGYDATRDTFRTQFGDGRARWTTLDRLESAWKGTSHAAIVIHPPDPLAAALRAAVQLEEQGKYALAAQSYRDLLVTYPRSAIAWTNLGNVEHQLGRNAAAEDAFRRALAIDPDAADALNNLAWLLYEEKRLDEAEPLARQAVRSTAPDRWTRLDTLGRILAAAGRCAEARSVFQQALDALPTSRVSDRDAIAAAAKSCTGEDH